MILPNFFNGFFSQMNPYIVIMDSICKIREEHKANNALYFVSDQIKIGKKDDCLDIVHCFTMENGQTMTMTYTLEISNKRFLPSRVRKELETNKEIIIEQNRW